MRNVKKIKRRRFRGLTKLIILAMLLIIGYFLIFETFRVTKIVVTGSDRYTEEEIKEYFIKDRLDSNSLYLYMKSKYKEKPTIPFVQDIDIKYVDRNTIEVRLYEKVVTGCVEFLGEYMYFDKDGIIVETSSKREENVPIILGLNFTRIALHEQLMIQKQTLFTTILNLTKLIHQYELKVDTISFDRDYEVTLSVGKSVVLLGKRDFYDEPLAQLGNILTASNGVDYIYDMRNYTDEGKRFSAKKIE